MELRINGRLQALPPGWEEESLLMALREGLGLVGCKLGCGAGQCGACTLLLDDQAVRSCLMPVQAAAGREIHSIEGLAGDGPLHALQQAWLDEAVAQCGYCQSGQMLSALALLRREPRPDVEAVDAALAGHLCRCGTQHRARRAVLRAAALLRGEQP